MLAAKKADKRNEEWEFIMKIRSDYCYHNRFHYFRQTNIGPTVESLGLFVLKKGQWWHHTTILRRKKICSDFESLTLWSLSRFQFALSKAWDQLEHEQAGGRVATTWRMKLCVVLSIVPLYWKFQFFVCHWCALAVTLFMKPCNNYLPSLHLKHAFLLGKNSAWQLNTILTFEHTKKASSHHH